MIPILDLVAQYDSIKDEIDTAINDVIKSGKFILGPNTKAFEKEVADYLGVRYAIGVASGTDASIIALRSLGIGSGDEVIIPAYSFFATAGAVLTVGAKPVFIDILPDTYLIDTSQIEASITAHTKAILPVHLFGQAADMEELQILASKHNLKIIEDNAQAFGAAYKDHHTGSIGDIGCLSFFPSKNLGAYGDAGMIVTNNSELAELATMLRTHGWKKKYFPEILGYNSRLDEIQAAVLRVKLKRVDMWNARRRQIVATYNEHFGKFGIETPNLGLDRTHVYHLYVIRNKNRDALKEYLNKHGIASEVYYPQPLHLTKPCRALGWREGSMPIAELAAQETLALPLFPEMSEEQVNEVIERVLEFHH